ncbi:MAG: hypothetical protein SLRJCFUN_001750 [Candidatus Fervidibacter sp.]
MVGAKNFQGVAIARSCRLGSKGKGWQEAME